MKKMPSYVIFVCGWLFFLALDLATKYWVSVNFRLGQTTVVIPNYFHLTLVHNTGAAFGLGSKLSTVFFLITSLVALVIVGFLFYRLEASEKLSKWGLTLILSGAFGNFIDRIRFGYVVDFLDVFVGRYHWPAFNVADSAITIGALLFAMDVFQHRKHCKSCL